MWSQQTNEPFSSIGAFYNRYYRRSPVTDLFFAPSNIQYIKDQLEKAIFLLTKEHLIVPITNEVVDMMYLIASQNPIFAYWGARGLRILNEMIIDWETRINYASMRDRKLYYKYYINADRQRVFPYGQPTKVTRGEVTVAPSGYMVSNPWGRQQGTYLKNVLHVNNPPVTECTRPYPNAMRT